MIKWIYKWKIYNNGHKCFVPYKSMESKNKGWYYSTIEKYGSKDDQYNSLWIDTKLFNRLENFEPTSEDKRIQIKIVFHMTDYFEGI
jgi:hypothetical protein